MNRKPCGVDALKTDPESYTDVLADCSVAAAPSKAKTWLQTDEVLLRREDMPGPSNDPTTMVPLSQPGGATWRG